MNELIHEKVSVILSYNRETGVIIPKKMRWNGRDYIIEQLTYYHRVRQGRTLLHIFHVSSGSLDFRLHLNAENLHWTLEELYDGTAT